MLLAAFAGGAFGASIGALPSFSLAGLMVIVGELYKLAARTVGVDAIPVDITASIGFGVVLGPHVAFGGGAAALAYAARQGYLESDFEYHQAKDMTRGLGSKPDVLAVGGLFGIVGYWIATLSDGVRTGRSCCARRCWLGTRSPCGPRLQSCWGRSRAVVRHESVRTGPWRRRRDAG